MSRSVLRQANSILEQFEQEASSRVGLDKARLGA